MSEFIEQLQNTKRWDDFVFWLNENKILSNLPKDDLLWWTNADITQKAQWFLTTFPFEMLKGVFEAYLQYIEFNWKYSSFTFIDTYTLVTHHTKETFISFQDLLLFAFNQ